MAIERLMLCLYDEVFRFNRLAYVTTPWLVVAATVLAFAAAAGTWTAIRAVVRLRPAQAMQPPARQRAGDVVAAGRRRGRATAWRWSSASGARPEPPWT